MAGIIDSFFVALGFKTDTSGLVAMKKNADAAKSGMLEVGRAIKTIAAGFVIKGIADIGNQFEQNKIQIAGFLSALGVSGSFNAGLEDAATTIQAITTAAAALPGEAEEYVAVFKAGLPFLTKALPGGSLSAMVDFTNQFTAIGKTLGVDADQIGRDLNLMIGPTGRAGQHVKTFQQMVPFMRQVEGQSKLTAQSFNAMTATKRVEILKAAFVPLKPMLDASASSFDAMWGALKSGVRTLVRLGTSGLFEGMKKGLERLTAAFMDSSGNLTAFGQAIVDNMRAIGSWASIVIEAATGLITWFSRFENKGAAVAAVLAAIALQGKYLGALLKGPLVVAFAYILEDLYRFLTEGESVTGLLVSKWKPAIYGVAAALALLGAALFGPIVVAMAAVVVGGVALAMKWDEIVEGMITKWEELEDSVREFLFGKEGKLFGFKVFNTSDEAAGEHVQARTARQARRAAVAAAEKNEQRKKDLARGIDTETGMSVPTDKPIEPIAGVTTFDPRLMGSGFGNTSDVNTTVTNHINISVDGGRDPADKVARKVVEHLQRRDRDTIRNTTSRVGL